MMKLHKDMKKIKGILFNIQRFSVHDGPGIRTVVFEKGCPLRCRWCANPESQERKIEIAWTKSKCIGCKICQTSGLQCNPLFEEKGRLTWNDNAVSQEEITKINKTCPSQALHTIGYEASVDEVLKEVSRDEIFYSNLDGGLTISGGEPLAQSEFTYALLVAARENGINTAIETTGFAGYEVFKRIAGQLDYLLMDIKTFDDDIHKANTGVSNKVILDNFVRIREAYPCLPIRIRTPVIPGVNDNEHEIKKIYDFISYYENVRYELLKYHRLGESKYDSLQREYPMGEAEISDEIFNGLKQYEFNHIENDE